MRSYPVLATALAASFPFLGCGGAAFSNGGGVWSRPVRDSSLLPPPSERPPVPEELFEGDTPLRMTLEADFRALEDDRDQESLERPGRVILEDDTGPMSLPVQVRTRGRFRLNPYICAFPPLRLRFPTDSLHGTVLHGVEKVKVVTHCRDNNRYEQYVLEEYLSYRIYGILTEIGFRVQLALITYRDRSGDEEDISRLAFLIEDEDAVAERLSGVIVEAQQANPNQFDPWQAGLMYLFQYLIGNTDWSIARFHNVEGIRIGDRHFPLPYDFDFSGFVNASYAGPAPVVARYIKNVRERYYWGVCSEDIDYRALFSYFNQKRESILDLIERQPGLTGRNRTLATMYVESFFEVLNDDREAEYKIVYGCREMGGKGANQGIP